MAVISWDSGQIWDLNNTDCTVGPLSGSRLSQALCAIPDLNKSQSRRRQSEGGAREAQQTDVPYIMLGAVTF